MWGDPQRHVGVDPLPRRPKFVGEDQMTYGLGVNLLSVQRNERLTYLHTALGAA